ncbi:hypothetical protein EXIGLDRAFT_720724 [Exidia glandulosa HHB12029]|uniref:Uncharacterized protein n=1 Tax=Exidia glandulosa HHB12029 TaxID=1314781 RepID=A0A165G6K2_EXIGL|nr:hypothetical protein EXIGLDRAFT_720724 [Exidia glandulosa HHB12029]
MACGTLLSLHRYQGPRDRQYKRSYSRGAGVWTHRAGGPPIVLAAIEPTHHAAPRSGQATSSPVKLLLRQADQRQLPQS